MQQQISSRHNFRHIVQALSRAVAVLSMGAIQLCALAVGGESPTFMPPTSVTNVKANVFNLKNSKSKSFTLIEYTLPAADSVPHIVLVDAKDYVWFSESGGGFAKNFIDVPAQSRLGRIDQNGSMFEWELGGQGTSPMGIAFDQAGDLWVVERLANRITRLRKGGGSDHYPVPTAGAWPTALAIASNGKVWFTETKGDKIGVIDPSNGALKEYPLPVTHTMSTGIAVDREGRVWIAQRDVNIIGMFEPAQEKFSQFPLPTPDGKPCGVMVDNQGQVWFSERNGGKLGTITAKGDIQEFPLPGHFDGPFLMVADRRGDVWFSEIFSNQIGRFHPADKTFEEYPIPGDKAYPAGLALDSKGDVWFAEQGTNKIGLLVRGDLSYIANEDPHDSGSAPLNQSDNFKIHEFQLPTAQSIPGIVAVDRNNIVWFTEMGGGFIGPGFPPGTPGSKVGYIRDGELHEISLPTADSGPTSLSKDPCGSDIWVTLRAANKIARIRNFEATEYDIPVKDAFAVGIAVDYDHNVWVALSDAAKIARMSPTGEWRTLDLPDPDAQPRTVFVDSKNEVWFAEKVGNHIGHVDKKNWTLERWLIPTRVAWPLSLEEDSTGNLWFAEMRADKIARIDRQTKTFTEYPLPVKSAPFKLLYDNTNSAFWVSTVFASSVMRFDLHTNKVVANYQTPSEGAWVGGLDRDTDSCIWFSEQFADKIGRLCISGVSRQWQTP
jgi:virginiamycin B lyase